MVFYKFLYILLYCLQENSFLNKLKVNNLNPYKHIQITRYIMMSASLKKIINTMYLCIYIKIKSARALTKILIVGRRTTGAFFYFLISNRHKTFGTFPYYSV